MLKTATSPSAKKKKIQVSLSSSFSIKHSEKGKDLHGVHCAILSSDSITHQTLPDMRNDPRISQIRTVARQP